MRLIERGRGRGWSSPCAVPVAWFPDPLDSLRNDINYIERFELVFYVSERVRNEIRYVLHGELICAGLSQIETFRYVTILHRFFFFFFFCGFKGTLNV